LRKRFRWNSQETRQDSQEKNQLPLIQPRSLYGTVLTHL
jgi:hypothetical protein